jgi:mannitol 2-dehydrogenase
MTPVHPNDRESVKNQCKESVLNQANAVQGLSASNLPFDRSQVSIGIVHIGVGRFHRAHQALYCHELIAEGHTDCGISAAYILPSDKPVIDALRAQNGLYTLVERDVNGEQAKLVGSILEVLDGHTDPQSVIQRLADPKVSVVTFTVTEAGYFFDPSLKTLLLEHPCIQNDLTCLDQPQTLYGYLAAGLQARHAAGLPPFTVQSCDNVQGNGDLVRALFLEFLKVREQSAPGDLHAWVASEVSFPNSMVDRITPAADVAERARAREIFGCDDALAVTSESYRQWVIEDTFCNGRPAWEKVGAQFVESVKPFEQVKIRLLNAGHSAISYAGFLAGFETIGEIVGHDGFRAYLERFFEQVEPTLPVLPTMDLKAYQKKLIERFANPAIVDQTLRICKDGSAKIPGFIIPTLQELLAQNLPTETFAFLIASYYAFLASQIKEHGLAGIDDPQSEMLATLVQKSSGNMAVFLADEALFGQLSQASEFVSACQAYLDALHERDVAGVLPIGR